MNSTKTLLAVAALAVGGLVGTANVATAQSSYGDRGPKTSSAAKPEKDKEKLDAIERKILVEGDCEGGLDDLDVYLKKNPKSVRALNLKAWAHNHIKEYEEAKEAADKVLAFDLFNAEAWREKGYACWKTDDLETARTNLNFAIQDAPKDTVAHKYLIGVLKDMGRTREAAKVQKALDSLEAANGDNPFNPK